MAGVSFPEEQRKILRYWREIDAFHRQLELTAGNEPWVFYDGPPFATGTPHYGHLLASTIKDIIPRYWAMKGRYVQRRFGWDTHGVPIEQIIDSKLDAEIGLRGRAAIEKIGIAEYNRRCREIVLEYAHVWEEVIGKLGRWIDFRNDYKTMDVTFQESCWWIFKQLYDKDLVYHGSRVLPYSMGLNTPLSKNEANEDYRDVSDPAVIVAFPLLDHESHPDTSFLIWTTTPWTLPSNIAVCAHPDFEYLKIYDEEQKRNFILSEPGLRTLYKDPKKAKYKIIQKMKGKDLLGLKYHPPFDYYWEEHKDHWFYCLNDTYVTEDSGVGIVHQAPCFGEEDMRIALRDGLVNEQRPAPDPLDAAGNFVAPVVELLGQNVKVADKQIMKDLENRELLIKRSQIIHSYPFCPRSKTPLIQRAVPSWFIRVAQIIPDMLENLEKTQWVPASVKNGRFHNWLAGSRDWNVSRNRFWGTPIPLWVSGDLKEVVCVGSIAELKELSGFGGEINDLHRDKVDDITIPSKQGKGVLRRIEEVFDCWFESGSMPYASQHYPFDPKVKSEFLSKFPGDFIAEGLDQTRGWFYTLSILGTHLFKTFPYKNVVVNGIVLANDGKKMSKSAKNFPDPTKVIDEIGSDALRLYLINSPVVRGDSLRFSEQGCRQVVTSVLLPLWNSTNFLLQQIDLLKKIQGQDFMWKPRALHDDVNVMDRWILAECQSLLQFVDIELGKFYRLYTVVPRTSHSGLDLDIHGSDLSRFYRNAILVAFRFGISRDERWITEPEYPPHVHLIPDQISLLELLENTTNWFIRFNRSRLKGSGGLEDTLAALNTLFEVLFVQIRALAPFIPFLTDTIFQKLRKHIPEEHAEKDMRSVHFLRFPTFRPDLFDEVVERRVRNMQTVINLGRLARERRTLPLKTPLKILTVIHSDPQFREDVQGLQTYIIEELNVLELVVTEDEEKFGVHYSALPDLKNLGIKFKKNAAPIKKAIPSLTNSDIKEFMAKGSITVAGCDLTAEDLRVSREIPKTKETEHLEVATEGGLLIILDTTLYPELQPLALGREFLNRVQRLRKAAKLLPTDDVRMTYKVTQGEAKDLDAMFKSQQSVFVKAVQGGVLKEPEEELNGVVKKSDGLIVEETAEVRDLVVLLKLWKVD